MLVWEFILLFNRSELLRSNSGLSIRGEYGRFSPFTCPHNKGTRTKKVTLLLGYRATENDVLVYCTVHSLLLSRQKRGK